MADDLRERLIRTAYLDLALERCLTIALEPDGLPLVPSHWREQAEQHAAVALAPVMSAAAVERTEGECVFCEIAAGRAPAQIISDGPSSVAIVPLNPVAPGHALFIPRQHVRDAYTIPRVTAQTVKDATSWARRDPRYTAANFITSVGAAATQSVYHLHVHVVPRTPGDGLALPWTGVAP